MRNVCGEKVSRARDFMPGDTQACSHMRALSALTGAVKARGCQQSRRVVVRVLVPASLSNFAWLAARSSMPSPRPRELRERTRMRTQRV
eukprot:5953153-Pleurochrysis_carterae.AAC.1